MMVMSQTPLMRSGGMHIVRQRKSRSPHRKFVSRGITLNTALDTRYYEKALSLEGMSGDVLTVPKSRCITFHDLSQPRPSEELICTSPELIYNPVT